MVSKAKAVRLVSGFTIDDVAEACRSAAIEFLDGVRDGWGKRELAAWLVGPYHQLSLLRCSADELAFSDIVDHTPRPAPVKRVVESDVDKTMRDARDEVLKVVARFSAGDPAAENFVWQVGDRGVLSAVIDDTGMSGVVPNEQATQRLVERILSLIAADYVARPLDYEERVAICSTCKTITFEEDSRSTHACDAHRTTDDSGIRPRVELGQIDMRNTDLEERDAARLRAHLTTGLLKAEEPTADDRKTG